VNRRINSAGLAWLEKIILGLAGAPTRLGNKVLTLTAG
jgi:hypothetical protein